MTAGEDRGGGAPAGPVPDGVRARLKARLAQLRADVTDRLAALRARGLGQTMEEASAELSHCDNHPGDTGSELFEREKDLGVAERLREVLDEAERALTRVGAPDYGRCRRCGRWIPWARLEAVPTAELCVDCQNAVPRAGVAGVPPPEQERLTPPFARGWDAPGVVVTDAEDIWQRVARYGTSDTVSDSPGAAEARGAIEGAGEARGLVQAVEGVATSDAVDEVPGGMADAPDALQDTAAGWEATGEGRDGRLTERAQNRRTRVRRGPIRPDEDPAR